MGLVIALKSLNGILVIVITKTLLSLSKEQWYVDSNINGADWLVLSPFAVEKTNPL